MSARQWVIDESGLTGKDAYWIEKSRLLDVRDGLYEWPLQLCMKVWVDFPDFVQAFEEALIIHGKRYSRKRLAATIAECKRLIDSAREYDDLAREMYPEKYEAAFRSWCPSEMRAIAAELHKRRLARSVANSNEPSTVAA